MNEEFETIIKTEEGVRLFVYYWDYGCAWLNLQRRGKSMDAVLTRDEAQQLLAGLQAILAKGVTA